jgi:hypothetical protein
MGEDKIEFYIYRIRLRDRSRIVWEENFVAGTGTRNTLIRGGCQKDITDLSNSYRKYCRKYTSEER